MPWRGHPPPSSSSSSAATDKRVTLAVTESQLRNVGIIAHIDAGKTTLSERLLYYSGMIGSMGEVHDGSATMDFMDEERRRGITIGAAAISLEWRRHRINLIDTPGHVDFTVEVERSLRVLDGAVVVLDASAGVQAQTLTVWRQASRYRVPALAYVNKMDRRDSDLPGTLASIERRLAVPALMIQLPLHDSDGRFCGVVDLASRRRLVWSRHDSSSSSGGGSSSGGSDGSQYVEDLLTADTADARLWQQVNTARRQLIERAADFDDQLATEYLQAADPLQLSAQCVAAALRRIALSRAALPTLCGSAYRNTAVQPLLDAIVALLPSPSEVCLVPPPQPPQQQQQQQMPVETCALAFKTVHDRQRGGALTYLRVYTGRLCSGQRLFNVNRNCSQRLGQLMTPYADRLVSENCAAAAGSIVVVAGLTDTVTGDTLVAASAAASSSARSLDALFGIRVPPPVYSCSVEAPSPSQIRPLHTALACLCREDPSLHWHVHDHSGQLVLGGMGELHLQIVRHRLLHEFGVDVHMAPPQVAYLETVSGGGDECHRLERTIADCQQAVTVHLHVRVCHEAAFSGGGGSGGGDGAGFGLSHVDTRPAYRLQLLHTQDNSEQLQSLRPRQLKAAERGVQAVLSAGPLVGAPVVGVTVLLSQLLVERHTADHVVTAAVSRCLTRLLRRLGCQLLEPLMRVEVVCAGEAVNAVTRELGGRRATLLAVHERCGGGGGESTVVCEAPLAELADYAGALRSVSSGSGTFSMELARYQPMNGHQQAAAIASLTGVPQA